MSGKRFVIGMSLSACVAAGCASTPRLKAYAGDLRPDQLSELVLDSRVRLVSVDGKQFPDATDDEASERARAVAAAPEIAKGENYALRRLDVAAGEHLLILGIAKHLAPVRRETSLAMVALTGHVEYLKKMYPGSAENVTYRLPMAAGHTYTVRPTYDRPDGAAETWTFKIRESNSSRPVAVFVGKAAPSPGGTPLSPADWSDQQRQDREAAK